ncbi:right-handed parallel beta-helix repeat-containing protein [Coraliomargarita parva]|uniref:right-handed parallel beta-helix repeat-containing protein n=1 Tax=Coraliomargarita parva TaxID=3014050 RepID=UPI0022B50931|nr:right-handed parallel beta-helix repeat-containing protein [Coraliomargarita parva]
MKNRHLLDRLRSKLARTACLLGLVPALAFSAEFYMTVDGAGSKDGSSWAHAYASDALATVLDQSMEAGDSLYLGGPESEDAANYGDLRIKIGSSGTAEARKSLIGVDRGFGPPSFVGKQKTRSYTTFRFIEGSSYWTVKDLRIEHREFGLATDETEHRGLIIDGLSVHSVREAAFAFANCDDLTVRHCQAERYSEAGFRFSHSCDRISILDSLADCTGTRNEDDKAFWKYCSDPVGFDFHSKGSEAPPNTDIRMENCVSINNRELKGSYPQGDGIKFERGNIGITLIGCLSSRNQDAGYDLKGTRQTLKDCKAISNRRYGFKVWYDGELVNCISVDHGSREFTLPSQKGEHAITAKNCTFHGSDRSRFIVGTETAGTTVILENCILSFAGVGAGDPGSFIMGPGEVILKDSVTLLNASVAGNPPRYEDPTLPWYGKGPHFNNQSYAQPKGYHSVDAHE